MSLRHFLYALCLITPLSACAVGPDYAPPAAPDIDIYDRDMADKTSAVDTEGGAAQSFKPGEDIPAGWWDLFHSAALNGLVAQAIQNNPDLEAANAALRAAEADITAADAALFPTVTGDFSTVRQKTSKASSGGQFGGLVYTLHNASVGVSYPLDVFGGARRGIEQAESLRDVQGFQREAVYLTLTSNVVTAAIQQASLRTQIAATHAILEDEEKNLKTVNAQFELGAIAKSVVLVQATTVAQTRATLPPLEHDLAVTRHEIAALIGEFPSQGPGDQFDLAALKLPEQLPLSLPSKLVEQRPDIRAAEANLHAASAAIGVAEAARFPQITLSADIGTSAINIGKLFTPGSGFWSLGFDGAQTLFDAGALAAREDAARALYDEAAAQYRKTVLAAFQNVADVLHALQSDADALKANTEAQVAAAESLGLAQAQYKAGAISYPVLLNAQQAEQQARLALVRAEAQRFADTAALFQALGGGWWNRDNKAMAGSDKEDADEAAADVNAAQGDAAHGGSYD
jgi:NodT family efflux transporter outer membrane factor (OMF) lipoprotein